MFTGFLKNSRAHGVVEDKFLRLFSRRGLEDDTEDG